MSVSPDALRGALEASLDENPDDLATMMAYADHLTEQGDPHGEFIQVQLDLADPKRSKGRRKALQQREKELIRTQERLWLGDELFTLLSDPKHLCEREYTQGWLTRLRFKEFSTAQAKALVHAPCIRLVRHLDLEADTAAKSLAALADCPYLGNVRELDLYVWRGFAPLEALVARLPRIEEINIVGKSLDPTAAVALPLPHLKELRLNETARFPLREIAANASLGRLQSLTFMPGPQNDGAIGLEGVRALVRSPHLLTLSWLTIQRSDMGDEGVRAIIDSGLLGRLQSLDLSHGTITDVGTHLLAAVPQTAKLYQLDVVANLMTPEGVAALEKLSPVTVTAYGQFQSGDDDLNPNEDEWE